MSSINLILEKVGVFRDKREFSLSTGLNLIYAPNASGKTSLIAGLKAVAMSALTPEELARVLNDYEEKGAVKLIINGLEYSIELIRKPDGTVEAWGKRLAENGVIKKVAFIDMENELVNAIYSGNQEQVKLILREVTGVSYMESIISVLTSLKSEYEYAYSIKRKEYEGKKEVFIEQRKRLEERLENVRNRIKEILRNPQIEPARKEIEELESARTALIRQLRELRGRELDINNRVGLLEHDHTIKSAELNSFIEQRKRIVMEMDELKKRSSEIRKRIEALRDEKSDLEKKRSNIANEINEKEKIIVRRKSVLEYSVCSYCGSPIDKDKLLKEIAELEESITNLRSKLVEIDTVIREKELEISELREKGEERLKALDAELKKLDEKIRELEKELRGIKAEMDEEKEKLEELRKEVKSLDEELRLIDAKLSVLRDKVPLIDELRYLTNEEQKLYEDLDNVLGRLRQLDILYSEVKVLEDRLDTTRNLIEYFQIRLNELKHVVIEKINEIILKHLKLLKLAELEYPILAEDFTLTLSRAGRALTTLAELSDAEKAIFTILMTLVLKDYIAHDFPFYVVDTLIEFVDDARAREILRYLMEIIGNDKIVIVTKTKPFTGEPKLLSQDDILVNRIQI